MKAAVLGASRECGRTQHIILWLHVTPSKTTKAAGVLCGSDLMRRGTSGGEGQEATEQQLALSLTLIAAKGTPHSASSGSHVLQRIHRARRSHRPGQRQAAICDA